MADTASHVDMSIVGGYIVFSVTNIWDLMQKNVIVEFLGNIVWIAWKWSARNAVYVLV